MRESERTAMRERERMSKERKSERDRVSVSFFVEQKKQELREDERI